MSRIKIISHHTKYEKGQIVDLAEKEITPLLTNGKAIRVRKIEEVQKDLKKDKEKETKPKNV